MTASLAATVEDVRVEPRDPVYHPVRARNGAGVLHPMVLVNLSPNGLMARFDGPAAAGDLFRLSLPLVGTVVAEVRWSLAGRIGCRLTQPIAARDYPELLALLS
jgi:hypothetical protein